MKSESLWLEFIIICGSCSFSGESWCLKKEKGTIVSRHFYIDHQDLPITIEVSRHETQKLASHIFQILLNEVMGYQSALVESKGFTKRNENGTSTIRKVAHCHQQRTCSKSSTQVPVAMVNLEVWLIPGFSIESWTSTGDLDDCGPLGPLGISGWFVPNYSVSHLWTSRKIILDHWKALKDSRIATLFDLTEGSDNMLISLVFNPRTNHSYCTSSGCDDEGMFRPPQCRKKTVRCATLLVDFPGSTFEMLKHQIMDLSLLVNVAWVGENLLDIVRRRIIERRHVMFYHIKPSLLLSLGEFTRISFPECEDYAVQFCEYPLYQMQKLAWSKIRTNAPHVFHLLKKFSFTQSAYATLLHEYHQKSSRGLTIYDAACTWVRKNRDLWETWLADDLPKKTILYIGGIFPMTGVYWKQSQIVHAAKMAVDAVNQNSSVLGNYHLSLLEQDGQCVSHQVVRCFINYVTNSTYETMIGILGPACSDTVQPLAAVAKYFNTIIISYSAEGSLFSKKEKYSAFFRTMPENKQFRFAYLKLFQRLKWNYIAALTEQGQDYTDYISQLEDLSQLSGIHFVANRKFPRRWTSLDITDYLMDLKDKNVRIIIGDFYDHAARTVMCTAFKLGMTAAQGYQWFLPPWFNPDWYDTDFRINSLEHVPCTTEQMKDAIDGHLSLGFKSYADPTAIMQENKTISQWMASFKSHTRQDGEISQYGGYAYDAVWAYANALHALFKENRSHVATLHSSRTTRRLVELLNETRFSGVSGYVQFLGSNRLSEILIWQWVKGANRRQVGSYRPYSYDEGELLLDESQIVWTTNTGDKTDKHATPDECHLGKFKKFFRIGCQAGAGITVLLSICFLLSLMILGGFFLKRRYEKRILRTEVRLKELGLMKNITLLSLDGWEMQRDHIVINRKLGEGAFGAVFGGEAFVENTGWVAVAIKTLKVGASPELKLDFLSEAEVMKNLNHVNIVQLIGVCASSEPLYLVMEFMLYGDLKTYLLARRHLVNEPNRENNQEISNRTMTNMALDIARGLSYLASLNYVHRDLACRNCLVNSNRTVKLADFGLCRPLYDSSYYRFTRVGMLPVRWMSPESISDGLFTPMSDVWSYGVVLYEIITFGSFPYPTLTNNEVVKYVASCNTLNLPNGCDPTLVDLLRRCWSSFPEQRPKASEIVELLANNPELISPCLDIPTASVEVTDSADSLWVPNHEPLSWLWRTRRLMSRSSGGLSASRIFKCQAANKDYKAAGIEQRPSSLLDISYASYLFMGDPKIMSKERDLDCHSKSSMTQVTRL